MSTGVTSYAWAAEANRLLVPLDGALYVLDSVGEGAAPPRRLFDPADARWAAVGAGPLLDAKISADGNLVCFVWADEVCCCAVPTGAEADAAAPRRLTSGARGEGKTNGLADYCAQELTLTLTLTLTLALALADYCAQEEMDPNPSPSPSPSPNDLLTLP